MVSNANQNTLASQNATTSVTKANDLSWNTDLDFSKQLPNPTKKPPKQEVLKLQLAGAQAFSIRLQEAIVMIQLI